MNYRRLKANTFLVAMITLMPGTTNLMPRTTNGEETTLVRVEEDWEVEVGEPELSKNAPQVSMVMSPLPDLTSYYFIFDLNFHSLPNYSEGGAQVQLWDANEPLDFRNSPLTSPLDQDAETLRWTQKLSLQNGIVTFEIDQGTSTSWGDFGGQGYLKTTVSTGQTNLNDYRPTISLIDSGIGYAGNRVVSLKLLRLKWVTSSGEVHEIHAPIDIDSDLDPWD